MQNVPDLTEFNGLAQRLLGEECAEAIHFDLVALPGESDSFRVFSENGGVSIQATSGPALGVAFNRYLNEVAGVHFSLHGRGGKHTGRPSLPSEPITGSTWTRDRYFLNYCCFSYSMPFWDWTQWERLIDWMVLRGVNRPLAVTGQEAVWLRVGKRLGLSREDMREFLSGPAYLPFNWMGCLDTWGGPLSDTWCHAHEKLGRRILARERAFGMTPVLQGFTGHVPAALGRVLPADALDTIQWHEWSTCLLDPLSEAFETIAGIYLREQNASFGSDHLYAADTFIEMKPPSGDPEYLRALGVAIYEGMRASDPDARWVLQSWVFSNAPKFWTLERIEAFLGGVPAERMLILDLFCETRPMWRKTNGFQGRPWLWCNVQSFGANTILHGSFAANRDGLLEARNSPEAEPPTGIGIVNEGFCPNPVAYDFFFDQAWLSERMDTSNWIKTYLSGRYGALVPSAVEAWTQLVQQVYLEGQQPEQLFMLEHLMRPHRKVRGVPRPAAEVLHIAWSLLLKAGDALADSDPYRFDLVNVGRQVLSNHASWLKSSLHDAFDRRDAPRFHLLAAELRELLSDMETLVQTRGEFLLGCWIADAVGWGRDPEERRLMEMNARRIVTLWGETSKLVDYARKEWSGLLSTYYLPRWNIYLRHAEERLACGGALDVAFLDEAMLKHEAGWVAGSASYPTTPSGDAFEVSAGLVEKYALQEITARLKPPETHT